MKEGLRRQGIPRSDITRLDEGVSMPDLRGIRGVLGRPGPNGPNLRSANYGTSELRAHTGA